MTEGVWLQFNSYIPYKSGLMIPLVSGIIWFIIRNFIFELILSKKKQNNYKQNENNSQDTKIPKKLNITHIIIQLIIAGLIIFSLIMIGIYSFQFKVTILLI